MIKKNKIGIIVSSRINSNRLPAKAMLCLSGDTILSFLLKRISTSKLADIIILATTYRVEDNSIANEAIKSGCNIFRGELDNVLDRYVQAAIKFQVDIIVRLTGDNPFIDGHLLDYYIDQLPDKIDKIYTTRPNVSKGLNVEIIPTHLLSKLNKKHDLTIEEREHVTLWFYKNRKYIKELSVPDIHRNTDLNFSIDELEDYIRAESCIRRLSYNFQTSIDNIIHEYTKNY